MASIESLKDIGKWLSSTNRLSRLKARRRIWLKIHLWIGLFAGAILSITSITGSILVFHQEIDELLNPKMMVVQALPKGDKGFRPVHDVIDAAKKSLPNNSQLDFAYYPRNDEAVYHLFFSVLSKSEGIESWRVFVNPYTARVTGKRLVSNDNSVFPKSFIPFVFELHYALLLDWDKGSLIVGVTAVMVFFLVLTGLILWWPLTGKWRQAVTIKRRASLERFNYDLHKTMGFYSAILILVLLVSGIYFNLSKEFHSVVDFFSPVTDRYALRSEANQEVDPISMAEAINIVNSKYPEGRIDWLYGATSPDGTYTVCKRNINSLSKFVGRRCVVIDQYSGDILFVQAPDIGSKGDYFILWQWPLHSGQAFGLSGRIIVFLIGIVFPLLFITGVIRWRQKSRAARKSGINKNGALKHGKT